MGCVQWWNAQPLSFLWSSTSYLVEPTGTTVKCSWRDWLLQLSEHTFTVQRRCLCVMLDGECENDQDMFLCSPSPHRACYGVLRFIMESGARGCEVIVSGKLRGQRAKSMKFVDGLMIHAGNPTRDYIQSAVTHVLLRQGQLVCIIAWGWLLKPGTEQTISFHSFPDSLHWSQTVALLNPKRFDLSIPNPKS